MASKVLNVRLSHGVSVTTNFSDPDVVNSLILGIDRRRNPQPDLASASMYTIRGYPMDITICLDEVIQFDVTHEEKEDEGHGRVC